MNFVVWGLTFYLQAHANAIQTHTLNNKFKNENRHIKVLVTGKDSSGSSKLCEHLRSEYSIITRRTDGFIIDKDKNNAICQEIFNQLDKGDITAFLYCVNLYSKRFEEFEADIVNKVIKRHPNIQAIVVITNNTSMKQADNLREYIYNKCEAEVIAVLTDDSEIGDTIIPANGLSELAERLGCK